MTYLPPAVGEKIKNHTDNFLSSNSNLYQPKLSVHAV